MAKIITWISILLFTFIRLAIATFIFDEVNGVIWFVIGIISIIYIFISIIFFLILNILKSSAKARLTWTLILLLIYVIFKFVFFGSCIHVGESSPRNLCRCICQAGLSLWTPWAETSLSFQVPQICCRRQPWGTDGADGYRRIPDRNVSDIDSRNYGTGSGWPWFRHLTRWMRDDICAFLVNLRFLGTILTSSVHRLCRIHLP